MCRGDLGAVEGAPVVADDATDRDVLRRYLCIHFPHKLSPKFTALLSHPRIVEALVEVIGQRQGDAIDAVYQGRR